MTASMQAAVLVAPQTIRLVEVPVPEPRAGQVRLKLQGCGVCASNMGPWNGLPWLAYPLAPGELGHEAWGIIDGLGPEVEGWQIGDRVAALSYRSFAPYDVAAQSDLVKLPSALANKPFPGEPLGCAMNIFRRSRIEPGETVAIIGIGFLGALLTKLASEAGARVIAISRRRSSLVLADEFGAAETIPMLDHDAIVEAVRETTAGRMCERVIEAVGAQWPLDLAGALVTEGGTLVVAGYHQDGPRQVNMQSWNWKGIDVVNAHERDPMVYRRGIVEAVEAVANGRLDPCRLYTHRFPLSRVADALQATQTKPEGFVKALVMFD